MKSSSSLYRFLSSVWTAHKKTTQTYIAIADTAADDQFLGLHILLCVRMVSDCGNCVSHQSFRACVVVLRTDQPSGIKMLHKICVRVQFCIVSTTSRNLSALNTIMKHHPLRLDTASCLAVFVAAHKFALGEVRLAYVGFVCVELSLHSRSPFLSMIGFNV